MNQLAPDNLYEIALNVNLESLMHWCLSSSMYNKICNNETFWRQRIGISTKPSTMTWKKFAIALERNLFKIIPLFLKGTLLGQVYLLKSDTFVNLLDQLLALYQKKPHELIFLLNSDVAHRVIFTYIYPSNTSSDDQMKFSEIVNNGLFLWKYTDSIDIIDEI